MLDWALRYIALRWRVFPLGVRSKMPMIPESKGGHGCLDATIDETQIREWWKRWPKANIGLATGYDWWALDIDTKAGGYESWDILRAGHGALPPTPEATTGTGGRHVLYLTPSGSRITNSEGKL